MIMFKLILVFAVCSLFFPSLFTPTRAAKPGRKNVNVVSRPVSTDGYMPQNEFTQTGSGTTYYVDDEHPSASDTASGQSENAPFKTLERGVSALQAGDTLLVKDGYYTPTSGDIYKNWHIEKKGTASNYILIAAYPNHRPEVYVDTMNGVQIWNSEYLEFRGFQIRGIMPDPSTVDPDDTHQNGNGISVFGNVGNAFIRVVDNHIHHVGGNGIGVSNSDHILILGNRVWHCTHRSKAGNSGISIISPKNHYQFSPPLSSSSSYYGIIVASNECFNNVNQYPFKYAGIITDGNGIIFDYYSNDGDRTTYSKKSLAVNNICHNNGGRCLHTFKYHDTDFMHNTCYGNLRTSSLAQSHGEISAAQSTATRVYNNIVFATNAAYALTYLGTAPEGIADTNLFYGASSGVYPNGNPISNTISADPAFLLASTNFNTVNLRLQATSAAINVAQLSLSPFLDIDFDGNARPVGTANDIGAFEFLTPTAPSATPATTVQSTPSPSPTQTSTPTPTQTPTPTTTPVASSTSTATPAAPSQTPSVTPTRSTTPTPSITVSPSPSVSSQNAPQSASPTPTSTPTTTGTSSSVDYMPYNHVQQSGNGNTYIVDKDNLNANDGNAGTEASPLKTLAKGVSLLSSGDILMVKNGDYTPSGASTYNWHIQMTGTEDNWIVIAAFPGHQPTIHVNTNNGVQIFSSSYVEFRGFEISGAAASASNGNCLSAMGSPGNKFVRITNNHIHDCGGNGIVTANSDQLFIAYNRVWHTAHGLSFSGGGITISSTTNHAASLNTPYGTVVAANYIYGNTNANGNGVFFNWCRASYSKKILAVNNVVHNNGGRCIHAVQSHHADIMYNSCYNNLNDASLTSSVGEISLLSSCSDIRIYNNIIRGAAAAEYGITFQFQSTGEGNTNILYGATSIIADGNTISNTIIGDPQFEQESANSDLINLRLSAGSIAVDAADAALGDQAVTVDADGSSRPKGSGFDIGAYERSVA